MSILIMLVVLIIVLGAIGMGLFTQIRKTLQEQKGYERGLKMITLLIHLPPTSDDTQVGGRDARDVLEETISKAQIIYNIITSTYKKGFKDRFYGQRHFSFEIVGWQGIVNFYATVPVALEEVVKQAVLSAYPTARLEETTDHNIFNPTSGISGVVGGELSLKEPYAYPIATYQDLQRDALQGILSSLSTLDKEDGIGIQFLMRPANPSWRKTASGLASKKRKGKDDKPGVEQALSYVGQLATALVKPPEAKEGESSPKSDLSGLDQSILDAIDDKTRHPGCEVLIRIVASSNLSHRAEAILKNVEAAFSLFDSPGKNGFKYEPAKDINDLVDSYIMRLFPPSENQTILNSVELATLFHFPDQSNIPTSQLSRQDSKQVDGPRNIPEHGLLLGYNIFRGVKKPIRLDLNDRQRHMYVVGQTGTGKSTFLENLALQDMLSGNGFAFVDPHGDVAERLLAMVPKERTEDIIYFSPADMDYPMGLNLFEFHNADQKDFLIQEALNMLYKLYDPQHQGIMGPRYEHLFRMAALTVMADPAGGTFIDIPKLFRDPKYVQQKLQHVNDQNVIEFWQKEMPQSQRSNEFGEVVSWFVSKFGAFLSNEMMRRIIGQTKSAFDLRDIMDNKKILLVNLSKGRTGELNSKLLGMVFVMKFQAAAMSRANIPEDQRVDFSLYVDEFQNFSTDSFATIMSEARKYRLNLIVANQFTTQLTDEIRDAVFGNMGTIVAFRVGQNDVEALSHYFQPTFDAEDLLRIPNYNTIIRTLINGVPTQPFSMATLPSLGKPNPKLAEALKQLSWAKYGRPRATVEKEIEERLATKYEPAPTALTGGKPFLNPPGGLPSGAGALSGSSAGLPAAASPAGSKPSFLEEWRTKRQSTTLSSMQNPNTRPTQAQAPVTATTQLTSTPPSPAAPKAESPPKTNTPSKTPDISSNPQKLQPVKAESSKPAASTKSKVQAEIPKNSSEGTVHFNRQTEAPNEDTIFIDREGNLEGLDDLPPSNK